jgi:hypothetical protein
MIEGTEAILLVFPFLEAGCGDILIFRRLFMFD